MTKNIYYTIIIGANSFIGKNLIKKFSRDKLITLTRISNHRLPNNYVFKIGDDLEKILPKKLLVSKIIYLAWERRRKLINGLDINISGLSKIKKYAIRKDCSLFFASSFSAIKKINYYGTIKGKCENLLIKRKKFKIFRIAMVTSRKGGLLASINNFFKKSPFVVIPGKGDFLIYTVNVNIVTNALMNKNISKLNKITYLYDKRLKKFDDFINTRKKFVINVPIILIKILLLVPHKLNIFNTSFNYDGFLGLVHGPIKINEK